MTIPDIVNRIASSATIEPIWVEDSKAIEHTVQLYCGQRSYVLSPVYSFLNVVGDTLVLESNDPAEENVYVVTLTIGLPSFTNVPTIDI